MPRSLSRIHTLAVLAQLRRAGTATKKRKVGRIPRPLAPSRIMESYAKALRDRVCALARASFDEVAPEILRLLGDERWQQERAGWHNARADIAPRGAGPNLPPGAEPAGGDDPAARAAAREEEQLERQLAGASHAGQRAGKLIDQAAKAFADKFYPSALHEVVTQFGKRTDEHARQQLDQQLRTAIGVPLSALEKPHRDRLEEWAARNVDRIVTVPERYFDRLRLDVEDAFAAGTHPDELADQFVERYDMSERDAERIARDQVLKLSADLNHDRMEALGVERAIWRSMHDNRVCDDCFPLDGEEFDLATGIDGVLPGDCHPEDRCYSEPILDGLIGGDE